MERKMYWNKAKHIRYDNGNYINQKSIRLLFKLKKSTFLDLLKLSDAINNKEIVSFSNKPEMFVMNILPWWRCQMIRFWRKTAKNYNLHQIPSMTSGNLGGCKCLLKIMLIFEIFSKIISPRPPPIKVGAPPPVRRILDPPPLTYLLKQGRKTWQPWGLGSFVQLPNT